MAATLTNRLNALKNLQLQIAMADVKFKEEMAQLECKHAPIFEDIFSQREKIVNGEYEPNEEEARWPYAAEENKANSEQNGGSAKKLKSGESNEESDKPGVADFWLKTLESATLTKDLISNADKPILKHLKDIKCKLDEQKPHAFTLEFHFGANDYFKNTVLSKRFEFAVEKDPETPLLVNIVLCKSVGTAIEWHEGKNVTRKIVHKSQTNKKNGNKREITKEEKVKSFFGFFETLTKDGVRPSFRDETSHGDDENETIEAIFEIDLELGQFMKNELIPKALLYFTGVINEDEDDCGFGGEFSDSHDDDDDDDDDHQGEEVEF
jgi:nucleosome assembly protein 1-like 1